jgi:threonine dehydrogenase-like Zn-dependent dehydrogenase
MMNFMVNNKFTFEKLVINKFQLEDAPEAFDMFDKGMPGKFIFLPNP